jgi:hypothetical protein
MFKKLLSTKIISIKLLLAGVILSGVAISTQAAPKTNSVNAKNYLILKQRLPHYKAQINRLSRLPRRTRRQRAYINTQAKRQARSLRVLLRRAGGTGTVDCINACHSEFERCKKTSAEFLCSLQSLVCLSKCAVTVKASTGVLYRVR